MFLAREPFGTGFSSGIVMVDTGVPESSPFLRFFGINRMLQTATIRSKSTSRRVFSVVPRQSRRASIYRGETHHASRR